MYSICVDIGVDVDIDRNIELDIDKVKMRCRRGLSYHRCCVDRIYVH